MGCNFFLDTAVWTFLLCMLQVTFSKAEISFPDLGLGPLPEITKINVSQDEYSQMMEVYLSKRRATPTNNVPHLQTFHVGQRSEIFPSTTMIQLPHPGTGGDFDMDSGELKLLIDTVSSSDPEVVQVRLYQKFGLKRRLFIEERTLYLSRNRTKWCEFDVTNAIELWISTKANSQFELICMSCQSELKVREAFVNVLMFKGGMRRKRSSPYNNNQSRRTDCRYSISNKQKMKCCRHNMTVTFKDLRFAEMASIVQPKYYEAGFCQGRCPPNYNYATNHSRIQTLVHQMNKRLILQDNRRAVPKACCSPSKLEPLEIIRVDPFNSAKLIVEKWENMQVTECACS